MEKKKKLIVPFSRLRGGKRGGITRKKKKVACSPLADAEKKKRIGRLGEIEKWNSADRLRYDPKKKRGAQAGRKRKKKEKAALSDLSGQWNREKKGRCVL